MLGWLLSCTVSRVELAPLTPLVGVRMPGSERKSSVSLSVAVWYPSCGSGGACDVRWTLIAGRSCSAFRGETNDRLVFGGGDLSLVEAGPRGASLDSVAAGNFIGAGASFVGDSDEAGLRFGVEAADSAR